MADAERFHGRAWPIVLLLALAAPAGCGDEDKRSPLCQDMVTGANGQVFVAVTDAQNYSFQSSMSIVSTRVKSRSNILFDWSALSLDLVGHKVDPLKDIDMIQVMVWRLPESTLASKLNRDEWSLSDLAGVAVSYTGQKMTSENYFDLLTAGGVPVPKEDLLDFADPAKYPPKKHSYSVMVSSGKILGKNPRMLALFNLDPGETNSKVTITNSSTSLKFSADLRSLRRVPVPSGLAHIAIDWSRSIKLNSLGQSFSPTYITQVMVAHYPDKTVADLETNFLDLELMASDLWRADIPSGTSVSLSTLTSSKGEKFAGVDEVGTWALALICGSCSNPAPWFLTLFEVCGE